MAFIQLLCSLEVFSVYKLSFSFGHYKALYKIMLITILTFSRENFKGMKGMNRIVF